jgi:hypothetical protein
MSDYLEFDQARYGLVHHVNNSIKGQFKVLLEEKHLYQSVIALDFPQLLSSLSRRILLDAQRYAFQRFAEEVSEERMIVSEQQLFSTSNLPQLVLLLQNVKLYCSTCKTRETFSPTWYKDATDGIMERHNHDHRIALPPPRFQMFVLAYQCETCKSAPVTFLIERQAWKLTMAGRSPFEEVDVPNYIPKTERWLFSEAIVAAQTGNTLAGLFLLRTFIEQFGRRQTGIKDRQTGEAILDAYQALLPEKQRDHMPSLKSWYEKLSVPIHAANADTDLFKEARTAILEHFDFRRLYKIPDVSTPPAKDAAKIPHAGESEK